MKNFDHRGRRRERDRGWWVGRAQSLRHNVWGRGVCRCWVRPVLTASRRVPSFQRRLSTKELHLSRNISTIERDSFFSSAVSDIKQIDGELRAESSHPLHMWRRLRHVATRVGMGRENPNPDIDYTAEFPLPPLPSSLSSLDAPHLLRWLPKRLPLRRSLPLRPRTSLRPRRARRTCRTLWRS